MKSFRISLIAAALLASSALQAADIDLYGRIDTGFLYTLNNGESSDTFAMTSGRSSGSRFGFKGKESLNDDWQVRFVLESGFAADSGELSSANRIFGRQSTVSLFNKDLGEIAFGRAGKPLSGADQFTRISRFTPFGVTYGDAGLLFYGKGGRVDNGIFYKSPTVAGFTAVLSGAFNTNGDEAAEWSDNTRFIGGSLDWKYGNFGMMIGAEEIILSRADEADNQDKNPRTLFLGASYNFGFMELLAGYQRGWGLDRVGALQSIKITPKTGGTNSAQIENWEGDSFMLGAKIPCAGGVIRLSGILVDGENGRDIASNKVGSLGKDAGYWAVAAGYTYPLSKRTNVYGVVSHLEGRKGLGDSRYSIYNSDGDLDREQLAVGLVHKF